MGNAQRHVEEVREQVIEEKKWPNQMVENPAQVQLGKPKIATLNHVQEIGNPYYPKLRSGDLGLTMEHQFQPQLHTQ